MDCKGCVTSPFEREGPVRDMVIETLRTGAAAVYERFAERSPPA